MPECHCIRQYTPSGICVQLNPSYYYPHISYIHYQTAFVSCDILFKIKDVSFFRAKEGLFKTFILPDGYVDMILKSWTDQKVRCAHIHTHTHTKCLEKQNVFLEWYYLEISFSLFCRPPLLMQKGIIIFTSTNLSPWPH